MTSPDSGDLIPLPRETLAVLVAAAQAVLPAVVGVSPHSERGFALAQAITDAEQRILHAGESDG